MPNFFLTKSILKKKKILKTKRNLWQKKQKQKKILLFVTTVLGAKNQSWQNIVRQNKSCNKKNWRKKNYEKKNCDNQILGWKKIVTIKICDHSNSYWIDSDNRISHSSNSHSNNRDSSECSNRVITYESTEKNMIYF